MGRTHPLGKVVNRTNTLHQIVVDFSTGQRHRLLLSRSPVDASRHFGVGSVGLQPLLSWPLITMICPPNMSCLKDEYLQKDIGFSSKSKKLPEASVKIYSWRNCQYALKRGECHGMMLNRYELFQQRTRRRRLSDTFDFDDVRIWVPQ